MVTATSAVPVERTDAYAVERHAEDLAQVASGQDGVVFFGDSITDWFAGGAGASVWSSQIAKLGAADFGIVSDTAEDLLWRVENGELAGHPKVAVVNIGTNDLGIGESVDQTVAAVETVVEEIKTLSPSTQIVLMGLFPRGTSADDPLRLEVEQVNAALAPWAPQEGVTFLDIDSELTSPDGSITANFLPGNLHPNASGYEIWATSVEGLIFNLLGMVSDISNAAPTSFAPSTTTRDTTAASSPSSTPSPANTKPPAPGTSTGDLTAGLTNAANGPSSTPSAEAAFAAAQEVSNASVPLLRVAQATTGNAFDPFADHVGSDSADVDPKHDR
jgi:lysophospholipase L1-like esterase